MKLKVEYSTIVRDKMKDLKQYLTESFGVDTDFRCLYVKQNYFFYYIDEKKILVAEMFNEREDFMYKLFGVKSNTEDSDEYRDE